jgi:predicted dithiol-disulfide oxidoreductase (DUF899 family)
MTEHRTGTLQEWRDARLTLLQAEKELTRRNEGDVSWFHRHDEYRDE